MSLTMLKIWIRRWLRRERRRIRTSMCLEHDWKPWVDFNCWWFCTKCPGRAPWNGGIAPDGKKF